MIRGRWRLYSALVSLALAVVLAALGLVRLEWSVAQGTMVIYPAIFFALVGLIQMYRHIRG
jgi:hypothetical protein